MIVGMYFKNVYKTGDFRVNPLYIHARNFIVRKTLENE